MRLLMADSTLTTSTIQIGTDVQLTELMEKLHKEKDIAFKFQERRHEDWNSIYELYRNRVRTNRLTQRQVVNIPLMKETIKTLLSDVDEPPVVNWKEKGGDEDKEILFQEIWNDYFRRLNFEGLDIQDKKNVLMYGRSFKKINLVGMELDVRTLDIYDIIIDPMVDPLDIETARFVIHQNIFRSLRDILVDERYTTKGRDALRRWVLSKDGIAQTAKNRERWEEKMERLNAMGVTSDEFPLFSAGDVIVNLTEHHTNVWNTKKEEFERKVVVYADDSIELLDETMMKLMGVNFYPFVTWAEDLETNDFWSDGPGDLVMTPNKVVNVWFSQMVENRTLRNFQMHWYDSTTQDYSPQTYEPGPGRMLPSPGNPRETIMPVEISGLDETMTSIDFLIRIVERGTGATSTEKGVSEKKQITLGEVELLVGKAQERARGMVKFYRKAWEELAMKVERILDANARGKISLYKAGRSGKIWERIVYPNDWKSNNGYEAMVASTSEQEENQTQGLQRMLFVEQRHPNNQALRKILLKRELEILDLTPEELTEVQNSEEEVQQQQVENQNQGIIGDINNGLQELNTLTQ